MNGRKDIAENVTVIRKQRVIKDYAVGIYAYVSTSIKPKWIVYRHKYRD